jgi:S1-C subfamily serine protease
MRSRLLIISAVLLLMLLNSCAYIIGGRTSTHFKTSTPNAKISLSSVGEMGWHDYELIGTDSAIYHMRNIRDYTVKQECPGYKTEYTPLAQTRFNYGRLVGYFMSLGFDALFMASTNAGWDDQSAQAVGIPSFFLGVGGWWLFPYGPKKMYEKKYTLPPMTILPVKQPDEKNLFVDQAAIKVEENSSERSYYTNYRSYKKGKKEYSSRTGNKINYENSIFADNLNKLLVKYQLCDTTKKLLANAFNSLRLRTTITSINTSVVGDMSFIELNTKWSLHDYFDKSEIVTKDYTTTSKWISSAVPSNDEITDMMDDALENALIKFLADSTVNSNLQSGVKQYEQTMTQWDSIPINAASHVVTVPEAVNAVVTVKTKEGHGSGCIISNEGWIITNYHVSGDTTQRPIVLFEDGTSDTAKVVRTNPVYDLALLKVKPVNLKPFSISCSKTIEIGKTVYAIGTPKDIELGQTVSKGIISGKRKVDDKIFIQTDVSINAGNSGGALINEDGALIGIVNAKFVGIGIEGIGFAIPSYYIPEALKIRLTR